MMNNQDNNGILCAICEKNGFIRYNCSNEIIVSDLQQIVDNSINLNDHTAEITNVLNNIREHNDDYYNQLDMLAVLAYILFKKKLDQQNMNSHIKIEINEMKNSEPLDCAVCLEKMSRFNFLTFDCNHYFCGECVINNLQHDKYIKPLQCYLCRHAIQTINIYDDKNIYDILKEQINT